MPRMRILTSGEQHALETPPQLNAAQRKHAFDLPLAIQMEASSLRNRGHQIAFYINAGYFRHSRRCFAPSDFAPRDVAYVAAKLGYDPSAFNPADYSQRTLYQHRRSIEELCGFRSWVKGDAAKLDERISAAVLGHERTKAIFYDCLARLSNEKVAVPSYRTIQDLILASIARNRARQAALIDTHLSDSLRAELDALMVDTETTAGDRRFQLTALKRHSQSVKPNAVKARLANHAQLSALFHKIEPIIAILGWEEASLQAYAAAVIKYDLHDLRRRKAADRYLHLIAFVAFQFYTLQDNLVATLLTSVKAAQNGDHLKAWGNYAASFSAGIAFIPGCHSSNF
jgi:Domain of unknown function (DUF4158)